MEFASVKVTLRNENGANNEPKTVEAEFRVDPSSVNLRLPRTLIDALGLRPLKNHRFLADGKITLLRSFTPFVISINGRECLQQVAEISPSNDPAPVLGSLAIEALDLVFDPETQSLIPAPKSLEAALEDLF